MSLSNIPEYQSRPQHHTMHKLLKSTTFVNTHLIKYSDQHHLKTRMSHKCLIIASNGESKAIKLNFLLKAKYLITSFSVWIVFLASRYVGYPKFIKSHLFLYESVDKR